METIILTPDELNEIVKNAVKDGLKEFTKMQKEQRRQNYLQDEILTKRQVKEILKISDTTFYEYIRKGKINAFKLNGEWRVKFAELQKLINE